MMGYLVSMFFLLPLIFCSYTYLFQFYSIMCCLLFIFKFTCNFYCNLSYMFGFDSVSFGLIILSFLIVNLMIFCSFYIFNTEF